MKNIAVVTDRLGVGGIEKALIELLKVIDYDRYNVSLFIHDRSGAFVEAIHPNVQVFSWDLNAKKAIIQDSLRLNLVSVFKEIRSRWLARKHKDDFHKNLFYSILCNPEYSKMTYDCVIAYQINSPAVVASSLHKVRARNKIAFFHGESGFPPKDEVFWDTIYEGFGCIFCVSESARQFFSSHYPNARNRTKVLYNIIDAENIIREADREDASEMTGSGILLLTVGRLSAEKGQNMIPAVTRILLDGGYDVHWYLVGDGYLRKEVEQECEKYSVQDRVILLGTKQNPYPFIRNCDIYVQTSRSEGWCLSTQEARILCKPIVTTDLPVMHEQFVSGENGLIVDAMTPEALAEGIALLIRKPELCQKFVNNLKKETFDNTKEVQKLYAVIEK